MSALVTPRGAVWKWPAASRKAHLFQGDNARSMCMRWLFIGQAERAQATNQDRPQPDDCVACWRKAKALGLLAPADPVTVTA